MNHRFLTRLIAIAVGTTVALASPVFARGGGHGGGGHFGGGGGMRGGGFGGGGMRGFGGGGVRAFGGGARFAGFSRGAFGPRFARGGFPRGFHRFHHRRFAFIGAPYYYADYGYYGYGCWQRRWTAYGVRWVNVCSAYGYY